MYVYIRGSKLGATAAAAIATAVLRFEYANEMQQIHTKSYTGKMNTMWEGEKRTHTHTLYVFFSVPFFVVFEAKKTAVRWV